jgi:hypothetical protein
MKNGEVDGDHLLVHTLVAKTCAYGVEVDTVTDELVGGWWEVRFDRRESGKSAMLTWQFC